MQDTAIARYTVQALIGTRAKNQAAYVHDAVTGDVAKATTGPTAIQEARDWADRENTRDPHGRCERLACERETLAPLTIDPYAYELYDEIVPMFLHDGCAQERADDV